MLYKRLYLFVFLLAGVILYTGCSSTSSSTRYKPKTDYRKPKDKSVRFTSDDRDIATVDTVKMDPRLYQDDHDDPDVIPSEESPVDLSVVIQKYGSGLNNQNSYYSTAREKILMEVIKYLNTPYKFGGNSKNGIDCSAFTQTIYMNTLQFPLSRTAREQYTQGIIIDNKDELEFGDLVFFNTRRRVKPGHVGIYIGENLFAHASSKKGVIVSSLTHEYYNRTYMGARRIESLAEVLNNPHQ